MIRITPSIAIDGCEIEWRFVRASELGGLYEGDVEAVIREKFPGKIGEGNVAAAPGLLTNPPNVFG